uniref:RIIa domain-containing protein 1 n=1 Tax=Gadus morhua TaxID=8049 RepID=A0A8C5BDS6_GADMO
MSRREGLGEPDRGALSSEQEEKLRQFKIKTRIDNEKYLRSHPEIDKLMSDFLRFATMSLYFSPLLGIQGECVVYSVCVGLCERERRSIKA